MVQRHTFPFLLFGTIGIALELRGKSCWGINPVLHCVHGHKGFGGSNIVNVAWALCTVEIFLNSYSKKQVKNPSSRV